MKLRRYGDWMLSVLLIWEGVLSAVVAGLDDPNAVGQSLACTNDLINRISCVLRATNCSLYRLHFLEKKQDVYCKQGALGQCRCPQGPPNSILPIYNDSHTVTVWKGDENLGSKHISIINTIKPRVPTVVTVKNSNGIFEILWKSNMENSTVDESLMANVTYFKKGETKTNYITKSPTNQHGLKVNRIASRQLEPSTTYVVCVSSFSLWGGLNSDCSAQKEFTTPMSDGSSALIIILSLSAAAVLISSVAFVCFVKLKTLWLDTLAKCPKPKLLMSPSEQMARDLRPQFLKPVLPGLSLVHVEPPMMDDSKPWLLEPGDQPSTFSSPVSPVFADRPSDSSLCSSPSNLLLRADDGTFRSCGFENRSYSIVLPSVPQQERSEDRTHGELICDPAYRGADGVTSNSQDLLTHLLLTSASLPLVDTDMSYQVHKPDSVQFPHEGDSSWSPVSSVDDAGETCVLHEDSRSHSSVSAGSISLLAMDFTYQTFESLVEPPDVLALEKCSAEERSGHPDGPRAAAPEPVSRAQAGVSGCTDNARCDAATPTFQAPFLSLFSADQSTPVIIESGYQSVELSHVW